MKLFPSLHSRSRWQVSPNSCDMQKVPLLGRVRRTTNRWSEDVPGDVNDAREICSQDCQYIFCEKLSMDMDYFYFHQKSMIKWPNIRRASNTFCRNGWARPSAVEPGLRKTLPMRGGAELHESRLVMEKHRFGSIVYNSGPSRPQNGSGSKFQS